MTHVYTSGPIFLSAAVLLLLLLSPSSSSRHKAKSGVSNFLLFLRPGLGWALGWRNLWQRADWIAFASASWDYLSPRRTNCQ